MSECLFCQLARDQKNLVWEDRDFFAVKDIHPKAKTHVLVMPKKHIESLDHLEFGDAAPLLAAVQEVARVLGVDGAYRVQINVGRRGGQEVDHLHVHVLAEV